MSTLSRSGPKEVSQVRSATGFDATPPPQDIQVTLQYLAKDPLYDHVKPLQITPNFLDTARLTNVSLTDGPLETLHDVRDRFQDFTLDTHGFQYVHAPSDFSQWTSQPSIGALYLPELEHLLRANVAGCDEILFYDARIRHALPSGARTKEGLSYNPFARQVHTDNTPESAVTKIHQLTDMKAEYLLRGRARLMNIWRPINHIVYDCGLAVASGASLQQTDVRECERRRADTGEYWDTMGVVQHRPGFEWHYLSAHGPEDVILFKNYDSDSDVSAKICLHTAFDLPPAGIPAGSPQRESIEVRALVFTFPSPSPSPSLQHCQTPTSPLAHPLTTLLLQDKVPRFGSEAEDPCGYAHAGARRVDIDEAGEVKDAELLLRKRRIRELEALVQELVREGVRLRGENEMQKVRLEALEEALVGKVLPGQFITGGVAGMV